MKKQFLLTALAGISLSLFSCNQSIQGTIIFELNGGSFVDPTFNTTSLTGEAGTRIEIDIPDAYKEGYFFVGWREIDSQGNYREITPQVDSETGETYYVYPYGTDTLYAYFEPLEEITFDLTTATDRNGVLIDPVSDDGSYENGVLSGYANKSIPSSNYLPTASGDYLYFDYWYTEYPLVQTTDSSNQTHYVLDTSASKGQYEFVEQFDGGMVFPLMEDGEDFVLKAAWEEYPTITVHFNLEGIEDYTFQAARNGLISDELVAMMAEVLNLDITADADYYTINNGGVVSRFDGFYLDEDLTQQFGLNSSLSTADVDLYLKWSDQINVTLDYNGGTYNSAESMTFKAFAGDTLESYLDEDIEPVKENADFVYFTLDGEKFDMTYGTLPSEDTTLYAEYDDYPTLTLSFAYPETYEGEKAEDVSSIFAAESDISTFISESLATMSDETMEIGTLYTISENGDKNTFNSTVMPDEDITIYAEVLYKPLVNLVTLIGEDDSYTEVSSLTSSVYLGTAQEEGTRSNISLTEETLFTIEDDSFALSDSYLDTEGKNYLYDGIYADEELTTQVYLPYSLELSSEERLEVTLYRKMTKAVTLTFYTRDENTQSTTPLNLSFDILPNKYLSVYEDELRELLGDFDHLEIYDEASLSYLVIKTFLPSVDSDIVVVY